MELSQIQLTVLFVDVLEAVVSAHPHPTEALAIITRIVARRLVALQELGKGKGKDKGKDKGKNKGQTKGKDKGAAADEESELEIEE